MLANFVMIIKEEINHFRSNIKLADETGEVKKRKGAKEGILFDSCLSFFFSMHVSQCIPRCYTDFPLCYQIRPLDHHTRAFMKSRQLIFKRKNRFFCFGYLMLFSRDWKKSKHDDIPIDSCTTNKMTITCMTIYYKQNYSLSYLLLNGRTTMK